MRGKGACRVFHRGYKSKYKKKKKSGGMRSSGGIQGTMCALVFELTTISVHRINISTRIMHSLLDNLISSISCFCGWVHDNC